jgi:hypothetical protein
MAETKTQAKYKNNMESAFSLLFIGILGVVVLILLDLDIIKLSFSSVTKIMMNIVMGIVFVIFIITGIVSYISANKLKTDIVLEADTTDKIKDYINSNITKEIIDNSIDDINDYTQEELYILRCDKISELITTNIEGPCEENVLSDIIEEIYDSVF